MWFFGVSVPDLMLLDAFGHGVSAGILWDFIVEGFGHVHVVLWSLWTTFDVILDARNLTMLLF